MLIGGSYGKIGSVVLSSIACLKSGCGLVTAFIPKCGYEILQISFPEAMILTDKKKKIISNIIFDIEPKAIGIGMGIGQEQATQKAFLQFLERNKKPLLIAKAMFFLREEKLVNYDEKNVNISEGKRASDINVAITQKGLIKIRTNGFKKEYERSLWNHRIERFNKLITPFIAFCALLIALYNLFNQKK